MERKTIKFRKGVRGSHNLLSSFCGARNHGTPSEVHKSVKMFGKTRKNGSSWGHRNMLAWWFYSPLIFKLWGLNSLCWLPTCLLKIYFNEESIKCKLLTLFSNHLSVTYSVCSLWERSESSQREEHQVTTSSLDLIQENMNKSSQWFLRELGHFSRPWRGEQSTNMASISIM